MASGSLTEVLRETLSFFDESGTPLTTTEVAEPLDLGRRSTYERLERLVEQGRLETKEVGANGRVWWRPTTGGATPRDRPVAEAVPIDGVLDIAEVAVFVLDETFEVAWINGTAERYFGLDREDVVGRDKRQLVAERIAPLVEDGPAFAETVLATYDDNTYAEEFECRVTAGEDREARWLEHRSEPVETGAYAGGRVELYYDVTERRGTRTTLASSERKFRAVFEEAFDAMLIADDDQEYVDVNPAAAELFGLPEGGLLGRSIGEFAAEDYDVERAWREFQESDRDRGLFPLVRADGERRTVEFAATRDVLPGRHLSVLRDVTDRVKRERRLRSFRQAVEASGHAIYFTDTDGTIEYVNPAFEEVTGYPAEEAVGRTPRLLKSGEHDQAFYEELWDTILAGDVWRNELVNTTRGGDRYVVDQTIAPVADESGEIEQFVAVNADVTDAKAHERALERQREQLAALDHLNAVVRDIASAVIEQSRRTDVERTVCEGLADVGSYEVAWIGDVDGDSRTVNVRTAAGGDGRLDGTAVPVDAADERDAGPVESAFRTQTTQVANGVRRDRVEAGEARSVAAVPLVHDGTVYGVLNVSADRPRAFEGRERTVISQLGEIVAQAIAAAERKRALISDEVVEVEFLVPDVLESLGLDATADGRVAVDHVVTTSDGAHLVYGTSTPDALGTIDALAAREGCLDSLTVISEKDDVTRFEARVTELPLRSEVASHGGSVEEVVLEDGDLQLRIHHPPNVDPSSITEVVTDVHPGAQVLAKRQFARPRDSVTRVRQSLDEELTDRQRAVLEAAYHGGFFEWPRDESGETIADSLGITPPTFSQHLRKAEKEVFDSLFSSAAPASRSPGTWESRSSARLPGDEG